MDDAALLEVTVTNPDARFRIDDFIQADPSQPEDRWQVAWDETFLTSDGETAIDIDCRRKTTEFEAVFVWRS